MSPEAIVAIATGASGIGASVGAAVYRLYDRYLTRGTDLATSEKIRAEAKKTAQDTVDGDVKVLREIIQEVRTQEAKKDSRIDDLERRLSLLEERERHMLTRAAVHEAWDQLAFQSLIAQNPAYPSPPPLAEIESPR